MDKKSKLFIGTILTISTIYVGSVISTYRFQFNGSLSPNSEDWNLFSNYFNGLLTPYFTFLNVLLFGLITYYLHLEQKKRNKKDDIRPFILSALNEMFQLESMALNFVAGVPIPKGTFGQFRVRGSQFALRYRKPLENVGVEFDQIEKCFSELNGIQMDIGTIPSGLEMEFFKNEDDKIKAGVVAIVMRAQIEIIEKNFLY